MTSSFGSNSTNDESFADRVLVNTCETDLGSIPRSDGEVEGTPIRVFCTLVTITVVSAWFSRRKCIRGKLLLFFTHWLSGLLYQLGLMLEATMILVCLADNGVVGFVKVLKFIELTSSNMYAITNLVISVNLAQIVMAYRTLSTVKNGNSSTVILVSFVLSVAATSTSAPFWDTIIIAGTIFWPVHPGSQRVQGWIAISLFFVEFFVGICMFVIVAWLLMFWMEEIKKCWKVHARMRYYFGLTLIGMISNLALGICGTAFVVGGQTTDGEILIVLTWVFRYIHIALETLVLYGVLGANSIDRLPDSSSATSGGESAGDRAPKRRFAPNKKSSSNHGVTSQDSSASLPLRF